MFMEENLVFSDFMKEGKSCNIHLFADIYI